MTALWKAGRLFCYLSDPKILRARIGRYNLAFVEELLTLRPSQDTWNSLYTSLAEPETHLEEIVGESTNAIRSLKVETRRLDEIVDLALLPPPVLLKPKEMIDFMRGHGFRSFYQGAITSAPGTVLWCDLFFLNEPCGAG